MLATNTNSYRQHILTHTYTHIHNAVASTPLPLLQFPWLLLCHFYNNFAAYASPLTMLILHAYYLVVVVSSSLFATTSLAIVTAAGY